MMCQVPGGEFLMGDDRGRHDERPAHPVRVGPFLLGRFPVTNQEYIRYLEETGANEPRFWQIARFNQPLQPVVGVSWFDAVAYCEWLSRVTGRCYRLPTEAEREWAAMGGLDRARYPWGDDEPADADARESVDRRVGPASSGREPSPVPPPAGGTAAQDRPLPVSDGFPNGYGLCHMADNVHEWCSDWYRRHYYAESPMDDPRGPPAGTRRASRGGAWRHYLKFSRCASRSSLPPHLRYNDYGFRVAGLL